ncbi:MAG: rod shape-determining protein MreC [Campylobacter sp.]|nr:rod shape-determining protein MreC [Campylobacter sp.]
MTNRLKALILILFFVGVSLFFGSYIKSYILKFSDFFLNGFYTSQEYISNTVKEHFMQVSEIQRLREENKELHKSAILLNTFANELDQILLDKNSSRFAPDIELVKTLSYANISDYNKFWVDFKEFDPTKVYGAIFQGNTIGVVTFKDHRPLAILQNDPKVAFSVYIGDERIPGVVNGDGKGVLVKYIPKWLEPKISDKIYTSGLDGIFFAGIPVGEVSEILDEDLYKSVVVKPYSKPNIPAFIYIITKDR